VRRSMAGVVLGTAFALLGAVPANAWDAMPRTDAAGRTYLEVQEYFLRDEQNTMTIRALPPDPDVPDNEAGVVLIRDTTARLTSWGGNCERLLNRDYVLCHGLSVYGPTERVPPAEYAGYARVDVDLGERDDRLNIAPGGTPFALTANMGSGDDYIRTPLDMLGAHVTGGDGADQIVLRGALGTSYVDAGAGADQVDVRNARADSVFCGADADIAYFDLGLGDSGSDCETTSESLPPVELP
jgi:hypothetical protein